jgi:23S rRNA (adenine2503-C2)-methyltransferase
MMECPRVVPVLTGLTVTALEQELGSRTRAVAAAKWIYGARGWTSELPDSIAGVSRDRWAALAGRHPMPDLRVARTEQSRDGTHKLLVALGSPAGRAVETVLIPARGRSTVCVSSQLGCTRSCSFCATARLGFGRNLHAAEIVAQYLLARDLAPPAAPATNVVFMGMGEPMDNLDAVLVAVQVLTQSPAPQLAHAQVTVSTSGVLPGMRRFLAESSASLALSLNATSDAVRSELMPQTKIWPIAELLGLLRDDQRAHPRRVHFIEYVMFDGVNDSERDAERLVELLVGISARVNLIPHNPIAGSSLRSSPGARVDAFHRRVAAGGVRCIVRVPRGQDIAAACGQLARTLTSPRS